MPQSNRDIGDESFPRNIRRGLIFQILEAHESIKSDYFLRLCQASSSGIPSYSEPTGECVHLAVGELCIVGLRRTSVTVTTTSQARTLLSFFPACRDVF